MSHDHVLEAVKPILDTCEQPTSLNSRIEDHLESLQMPAHVQIPLNIWEANESEYSEHEAAEFQLEQSNLEHTELKQEVECQEKISHQTAVKSMSLAQVDDLSLSDVESMASDHLDHQRLTETSQLVVLETNINGNKANVFSLADEAQFDMPQNNVIEMPESYYQEPCQVVKQSSESFYLNAQASVCEVAALNAPEVCTSTLETHQTEELPLKTDLETQQSSQVRLQAKPELVKPAIAKKPVIINKARQTDAQITFEITDNLNDQGDLRAK